MWKHGMTALEAFTFVRARRAAASPNFGFARQLRDYEAKLRPGQPVSPLIGHWIKRAFGLHTIPPEEIDAIAIQCEFDFPRTLEALANRCDPPPSGAAQKVTATKTVKLL
jgi:hypothetical protein